MQNQSFLNGSRGTVEGQNFNFAGLEGTLSRERAIGGILILALLAFELFNFDTTRYALNNLLGPVSFLNVPWAAILAIAFCSIDFAGLAHMFTPRRGRDEPREVWYLMGAWLLGAIMNALMTWWAVNLTLLESQLGNEVLTREQLLQIVPPFVALLVLLTRILFIGAFSIAGETFLQENDENGDSSVRGQYATSSQRRPESTRNAGNQRGSKRRPPVPQRGRTMPAMSARGGRPVR